MTMESKSSTTPSSSAKLDNDNEEWKLNDNKVKIGNKSDYHPQQPAIPSGAELLDHQIAGHRFELSKHKLGLLRHIGSGDILKPIYDRRSEREFQFYEMIFNEIDKTEETNPILQVKQDKTKQQYEHCLRLFRNFVPRYNGLFNDPVMNVRYIRLADLTAQFHNASVLDMKMGQVTYDPEASETKKQSELGKYRYAMELGFRILGMRVCRPY